MKTSLTKIRMSKGSTFATNDKSSICLFAAGIPKATKIYQNCPSKQSDMDGVINDYVIDAIDNMGVPTTYAIIEKTCDSKGNELRALIYDNQYIEPGQATIDMLSSILNGYEDSKDVEKDPLARFDAFNEYDEERLEHLVKAYNNVILNN